MSEDIWHTTDKNPEEDRLIVVKSKRTGEYLVGSEFEFVLDYFTKWAYFDDLLALEPKLERTRKAFDVAKDTIRHADWFFDGDYNVDAKTMHNEIKYAIKAITALEQKD